MTHEKMQTASHSRKKATTGIVFLIVIILVWQISSMFGKAANSPPKVNAVGGGSVAVAQTPGTAAPTPQAGQEQMKPKPAEVQQPPLTDREMALMTLQQETQVKYLAALNELQMLKLTRDIALTNKDISDANLGRVTSEKKIVDLLVGGQSSMPLPPSSSVSTTQTTEINTTNPLTDVSYTVVSISEVQYKWGAVLAYKNILYNAHVGDVLPADGSTVVAISKNSVTLQKNGARKKISLVAII